MMKQFVQCIAIALIAGLPLTAQSAERPLSGTLKKIRDSNSITLAVRESSGPLSYIDDDQQFVGYSIDLCMKIVDAIKAELKLPNLKINMTPVTSQTRIPLVANGTVDLECGSTTNTIERQKLVGFTVTTFFTGTRLMVKKVSNIKSYKDLKGKTVVVTSGTTNERIIKELDARDNLDLNFIQARENTESFLNLETGRAAAFAADDTLLLGLKAIQKNVADYEMVGDFLSDEPYAIMLRKDDPVFKEVADKAILTTIKSGEIERIYHKWFESPIPPNGVNLDLPMSGALKKIFQTPNDKGVGACNRFKC